MIYSPKIFKLKKIKNTVFLKMRNYLALKF